MKLGPLRSSRLISMRSEADREPRKLVKDGLDGVLGEIAPKLRGRVDIELETTGEAGTQRSDDGLASRWSE